MCEIYSGGTPNTNKQEYWNGSINWATLADTKSKYLYETQRKISELGLQNSSAVILPIDTVLFSSRATIGNVCIAKIEVSTNQGYKNFVCNKSKILPEYLYYILKREAKAIENLASGMTYKEISKKDISNYQIPVPPLAEQEKIIAEVAQYEAEIAQLEETMQTLEKRKKIILDNYLI